MLCTPAPGRSRTLTTSLLLLLGSLLLITCGGDTGTTPEDPTGGKTPRTLSISIAATAGAPGDHIKITGIPADVEWAYARVTAAAAPAANGPEAAAAQTGPGIALIQRTAGGDELVVPLHPASPMAGGSVAIQVTNGTNITSNTVTLDVGALTPAPGAFEAIVTKLETLLDGWITQQGTTAQGLRSVTADQLSPMELSLLLFHGVINHPDNPNSLRAFADGDIPLNAGEQVDRDVLDAVAALSGLSDLIDDKFAFVDTLTSPSPSAPSAVISAMRAPSQLDCIEGPTFDIGPGNCAKLAEVMTYQAELEFNKTSAVAKYKSDLIDAATTALSYARGAMIAWGIVNTLWAADNIEAGSAGLYPSFFISDRTDFTADPEEFPEDFTSPGDWSAFMVTASSTGWRFDDVLKEAFDKVKGLDGGFDDKTIDGLLADLADGAAVRDLESKMKDIPKNAAYDKIKRELNYDELTKLEYCEQTWENIDCTGLPYSEGSSPALDVDSANKTYEPSQVGSTTLEVKTTAVFGLVTPTAETKTIETKRIDVSVDPFQAIAEINQTIVFTATVANAENTDVEWYTEGSLPGDFQPNGNQCTIVTPSAPWNPAIILKARSKANTGLRENVVNSDPREGEASITNGAAVVVVTPVGTCLKPGEQETFTATVVGAADQSVTWSTDPPNTGSFNGDTYTAPLNNAGTVVIIATSVANPDAKGYSSVHVGECECWWTAVIGGARSFYWTGTNAVYGAQQATGLTFFTFETQVSGPGIQYPVISGFVAASAGQTGTFQFIGDIEANGTDFWTPGDPDSNEMPELTILSSDGQTIEGVASGPFFRIVGPGDPPQIEKLRLNLRFKATDGMLALCRDE